MGRYGLTRVRQSRASARAQSGRPAAQLLLKIYNLSLSPFPSLSLSLSLSVSVCNCNKGITQRAIDKLISNME